ncbi:MAG TPA: TlpA disulfide reductase family protein [Nocardioides sp.]|uniref:TlpA family protein disulfide reductase n=1 Tax=uncultured Nocardioides sp. TaxID=198441 RepID=UPI00262754A8|nr:TlpA disulfide reductase family protein [uncultured Nocardioides sp.]HRD60182.1 TlpA disulfide reductase family protein [Nocardioides sp.]HRI95775.1 TlpA disulfide reductase family protein [Nocardioides sp.]HRK46073.1 TlpA disulfide reductase family protein [Nocardioides sp.]
MRSRRVPRCAIIVAALVLTGALAGCDDETPIVPGPGPSKVVVDTPELRELKATTALADCAPGPGGGALPDITLPCLGGGTSVDLASLRGPLVLSFWYAGCEPCKKEMPALEEFHTTYGAQVPVIGVDFIDTYPGSALEELKERGVTYPSLADPGGELQQFEEFAKIPGMPTMFFVDEAGTIAFQRSGGVDSADEVADLVREHLGVAL